jgi:chromosomal replication initiator protein
MTHEELWKAVLGQMELSVSKANFITWFRNTSIISHEEGVILIGVPNGFAKEWLENKYNLSIIQALKTFLPEIRSIRCQIDGQKPAQLIHDIQPARNIDGARLKNVSPENNAPLSLAAVAPRQITTLYHESNLNPRYSFENFVVAENNELARAACFAVSQNLGIIYNPLFIYGGVGLGKTHLLQALGNEVREQHPEKIIKYITSERFTTELVDSIKNQKADKFKEYYQQMDLLIIDDIQFLSGREKTQQEFFHIFNALYQLNKQIIISSDRAPKSIATLEDRLRSRFEGGMIVDISRPNLETRIAILKRKMNEKNFTLDDDVVKFIAENIIENVRELEGALNRVIAYSEFYKIVPSIHAVEKILAQLIAQGKKTLRPQDVFDAIIAYYHVEEELLFKKGRRKDISHPRQVAMYLLRSELELPFSSIGTLLGGRDHTTALHAFEKISKEIGNNLRLKGEINSLKEALYHPSSV